ncbi:DNA gyrase subunit A [Terracidiphilus gabretensis]|jgi:DNA gyrase subunit A|uniref:DNA gyrase subunit A n=1 Tax=Terracidiphilus gabretensis TaxID=1577687 RepID=UPI00071BD690|nr:DNA gyrase subunit A [Terracidiphilus gabretensis]
MADDQNPQLPLDGGTPPGGSNPSLIPINIEDEMRRSYLDYSMSVIIGRALPDARDGLKPVHRRVLYTLSEMGLEHNKKYTKCAKVVGQAMGVYHPHGDSAIYDTLVRMAQPFSLRYPLVDGQGNFGSVDGDPPAAMRYTECRMQRIAGELLADIDMETVDMVPNYDESTFEPSVLPTRIPNLIVNGSSGIAVGMATNIPPHNLTEIVNATIDLVKNPKAGLAEVLMHVQGPDFPTGGFVYGRSGIAQAYRTGRGRFMMRARVATEFLTKEKQAIIVTEIPYQVNKSKLIERIAELANEKIIDEISDVRDESDRDGMRIVIELKRGSQPEIVLNQLYKHTQMQESFSMIFLAVLHGQPRELGLDQAIRAFIDHRVEVVQRRTVYMLRKAREREHILEGYKIALDNLDTVIKIIRGSGSRAEARENLYAWGKGSEIVINLNRERLSQEEKGLTLRQVDAVLELQLYRLTQLSVDEILSELGEIRKKIAEYESILASDTKLRAVIIKELEEVRDKYGDARRTQIVDESAELQLEDLIADEQVAVTVSHQGYLKRTPISTYRQQRRGGTGRMGMKTREEDFVAQLIVDSTHAYLLCFTNSGRVYWLKIYEIPDVGAAGKGKSMASLLSLQPGETVRAILPVRDLEEEGKFIFFATQQGVVKKTPLKDFSNVMARGIIAIAIDKNDDLVTADITNGKQNIFLATREGMAIRFQEEYDAERSGIGLRPMGRNAAGNKGITLKKGDYVIGAAITDSDETRDKERDECAKERNLTDKLAALRKVYSDAKDALHKAREDRRGGESEDEKLKTSEKNAEKAVEEAWSALKELDTKLCVTRSLILSVTENGFGKRTDVDEYRLTARGAQGVNNLKATPKVGKTTSILLVNETSELMVISQWGKIIRLDTKTVRAAGRATQGVRLLNLDAEDKVAAAVIIPPDELNGKDDEQGTLIQ